LHAFAQELRRPTLLRWVEAEGEDRSRGVVYHRAALRADPLARNDGVFNA
jgi:hypothetical protein